MKLNHARLLTLFWYFQVVLCPWHWNIIVLNRLDLLRLLWFPVLSHLCRCIRAKWNGIFFVLFWKSTECEIRLIFAADGKVLWCKDGLSGPRHFSSHFHCAEDINSKKVCTLKINFSLRILLNYICFSQLFLQTKPYFQHGKELSRLAFQKELHPETKCQLCKSTPFFGLLMAPYIKECHKLFNLFITNFWVF